MGQRLPEVSPPTEVPPATMAFASSHEYRLEGSAPQRQIHGVGLAKFGSAIEPAHDEQHLFGAGQIGGSLRRLREELGRRNVLRRDPMLLNDAPLGDPEGVKPSRPRRAASRRRWDWRCRTAPASAPTSNRRRRAQRRILLHDPQHVAAAHSREPRVQNHDLDRRPWFGDDLMDAINPSPGGQRKGAKTTGLFFGRDIGLARNGY